MCHLCEVVSIAIGTEPKEAVSSAPLVSLALCEAVSIAIGTEPKEAVSSAPLSLSS